MRYLLDTNIVPDLIRNPQGRVAEHKIKIGEQKLCTSIIVAADCDMWHHQEGFATSL